MSLSPPQTTNNVAVAMSAPELSSLECYAQANGMTLGQAALEAFRQQLQARYVTNKRFNNVVRFPNDRRDDA